MRLHGDPRRVLLLGGRGLLGTALQPVMRAAGIEVLAPPSAELDVRDLGALRQRLAVERVDLLVNSAAQASVEQAERDPERAFRVNALGAHNAALAAAEADIPLVHLSTDYVFDGRSRAPYRELDETGVPPNEYGRSKLEGELLVRAVWPRHFIVRVAALFGHGRPDFVDWVLTQSSPKQPLTIVADRFVTPTWTEDVARQLVALIRTPLYGTYHAAGHTPASWYELARTALLLAGKSPAGVVPVSDAALSSPARRAPYTALDNHLLRLRGLDVIRPWPEALERYLVARDAPGEA